MICRDVVKGALRKLGRLAAGREPRPADLQDGMEALRGLYRQWISLGTFGALRDVIPTGTEYTAGENERVFRNGAGAINVTLPDTVLDNCFGDPCDYGSRWVPPGRDARNRASRPVRDCSIVVIQDQATGITLEFLYDGNAGGWIQLAELTDTDTAPLSFRDPQGLQAALAVAIEGEFGGNLTAGTIRQAQMLNYALTHRFSSVRPSAHVEYC